MVTDAMVYTNAVRHTGKYWTDAGIALMQGGGIRASVTIGNITKFDLTTMLPFDNALLKLNVTGKTLMEALERSVERYSGDRGEFLQMSGLQVVYNLTRPANQRVVSAQAICSECEMPAFSPIKLDSYYSVIVSTFIYEGGDDFSMFAVGIKYNRQLNWNGKNSNLNFFIRFCRNTLRSKSRHQTTVRSCTTFVISTPFIRPLNGVSHYMAKCLIPRDLAHPLCTFHWD